MTLSSVVWAFSRTYYVFLVCIVKHSSVDVEEEHSSMGPLDFPRPLGDELNELTAEVSEIQKGR